jgi:hypothetical protein
VLPQYNNDNVNDYGDDDDDDNDDNNNNNNCTHTSESADVKVHSNQRRN